MVVAYNGGSSVDHYVPRNSNIKKKGDYKKHYNSKNTNNSVLQTDSMESLDSNIGGLNSNNYSNLSGSYGIRVHEGAAPGHMHSNITQGDSGILLQPNYKINMSAESQKQGGQYSNLQL